MMALMALVTEMTLVLKTLLDRLNLLTLVTLLKILLDLIALMTLLALQSLMTLLTLMTVEAHLILLILKPHLMTLLTHLLLTPTMLTLQTTNSPHLVLLPMHLPHQISRWTTLHTILPERLPTIGTDILQVERPHTIATPIELGHRPLAPQRLAVR
jgi:hypothetical protein